jgi:hypothetical protein
LIAYDYFFATPYRPAFRVTMDDGSIYYVNFNDKVYEIAAIFGFKDQESGSSIPAKLEESEITVIDAVDDKLFVLREL